MSELESPTFSSNGRAPASPGPLPPWDRVLAAPDAEQFALCAQLTTAEIHGTCHKLQRLRAKVQSLRAANEALIVENLTLQECASRVGKARADNNLDAKLVDDVLALYQEKERLQAIIEEQDYTI